MIEILVAVGIAAVVAALAVPVSSQFLSWAKSDSSTEFTLRAINVARDRAIAERRNIELTFILPNTLRLERQEVDSNGMTTGNTVLSEVILEGSQQFLQFSGVPDTPDGFGASTALTFGGTPPIMFTSDGSLVDSAGDVVNGSVFVGQPYQPMTARAVTIFGVSGLTRAWKWRGSKWVE